MPEQELRDLFDRVLGRDDPPPMAELLARLEARLVVVRPDYLANLRPGLSEAKWHSAAERLGVPVPQSLEALYRWRNGLNDGRYDHFIASWEWMNIEDVIDTKDMYDSMIGSDFEPGYWERGWIPFLHNGSGSRLCLNVVSSNGNPPGCLVEFWKADQDRPVAAPSLEHWLFRFVRSLETDVWEVTDGGLFECVRTAE